MKVVIPVYQDSFKESRREFCGGIFVCFYEENNMRKIKKVSAQ